MAVGTYMESGRGLSTSARMGDGVWDLERRWGIAVSSRPLRLSGNCGNSRLRRRCAQVEGKFRKRKSADISNLAVDECARKAGLTK